MNKRFLLLMPLIIITNSNIFANNADTKIFIGGGAVISFDRSTLQIDYNDRVANSKKTLKTCGIQLITGLTKYLSNNVNISITHESSFLSKSTHTEQVASNNWYKLNRQTWLPSFGLSIGYDFNCLNIGINSGFSINRLKYAQYASEYADNPKIDKNICSILPYVGIFIEKKFNQHDIYVHVDHIFKKKRLMQYNYLSSYDIGFSIYNKYSSWKVAVGAKYTLKVF